jgi:hypothetical protein
MAEYLGIGGRMSKFIEGGVKVYFFPVVAHFEISCRIEP